MSRCGMIPVWVGIVVLCAGLLMGRDCPAQTNLCDPDPCEGIANAVPGTCTPIPGGVCQPIDFACQCSPGYTWPPATKTCVGGPAQGLLPDTGQDLCYDNTAVIECPAPGQPFYGQDAQYVTNPMSYTVSPDGLTVTDNVTGLMWQRCSAGLSGTGCSTGSAATMPWENAISYCDGLSLGGYTDWRLPNEYELQSIVHYGRYDPAIDTGAFPGTRSSWYWSSSAGVGHATYGAWYVHFLGGYVYHMGRAEPGDVRCVR